jgi:hypothetical protein
MGRTCRNHGGDKKCAQKLFTKRESKRLFESSAHRWEDNIKIDLKGIGCKVVYCMQLGQDVKKRLTVIVRGVK